MRRVLPCVLALVLGACGASTPPETRPAGATDAEYAAHVKSLRERLAREAEGGGETRFTVIVQKPFVVVGDGGDAEVRGAAERTVKWAVDMLKKDFFEKDPGEILEIYLFRDKASYERHTRLLFNDSPSTPYGYFSPRHKALIMNIATGGGTLVHEIVHPYMAANFPECPAWFNEGLGSLFEQSSQRDGHIVGLTNWRLAGLQAAVRAGKVPSFKTLLGTTTDGFYGDERGTNYAQARYLLYYLQEKGLLRGYYRAFVKDHGRDPTGYATLLATLGLTQDQMAGFQNEWERWVLGLRFP